MTSRVLGARRAGGRRRGRLPRVRRRRGCSARRPGRRAVRSLRLVRRRGRDALRRRGARAQGGVDGDPAAFVGVAEDRAERDEGVADRGRFERPELGLLRVDRCGAQSVDELLQLDVRDRAEPLMAEGGQDAELELAFVAAKNGGLVFPAAAGAYLTALRSLEPCRGLLAEGGCGRRTERAVSDTSLRVDLPGAGFGERAAGLPESLPVSRDQTLTW